MKSETESAEEAKVMHPLKRHRLAAGLTLDQFAELVGVSRQSVWSWESGASDPQPGMYPKIAKILGITPLEVTELISPSEAK